MAPRPLSLLLAFGKILNENENIIAQEGRDTSQTKVLAISNRARRGETLY